MGKEVGRQCKKCDFAWYAVPAKGRADKPRFFDESAGFFSNDATGRMVRRVANYDREQKAIADYAVCPNCGSQRVATRAGRDFRATGRLVPAGGPAAAGDPAAEVAARSGAHLASGWRAGAPAPSPAPPSPPTRTAHPDSGAAKRFYLTHWRLIWAVLLVVAPFTGIGDDSIYTHVAWLNVAQFAATLALCWAGAGLFYTLHRRHRGATGRGSADPA